MAKGNITVHTENIFPIIKKWLYSDKDIFLRELVSNACDAITKFKKIYGGEEEARVDVIVDKKAKTITISDNGIGMTAEEVERYITQVAFSGVEDFMENYKGGDEKTRIIGHFGMGFYSAFMVSDVVEIETLSAQEGVAPAHWSCDGGVEYDLTAGARQKHGTDIILHVTKEDKDFLDADKVRGILEKYCAFLPVPVFFPEAGAEAGPQLNDTDPLWYKKPSECKDEEYIELYRRVFHDYNEPLFWIHMNIDYPFDLKGILFFPKLTHEFEAKEGVVKLFNNKVFVADNVSEVIPDYLLLLKGMIDCPDLPLNVSRSYLQNDAKVRKISAHIVKKIADKLTSLYKKERENYNRYWDDINPFIKYGCMRDEKFYEKVKDILVLKTTKDRYITLPEYKEENGETVYYATSEVYQSQYINLFKEQGIEVALLPMMLDTHFVQFMETKHEDIHFKRIDAALDSVKTEEELSDAVKETDEQLTKVFQGVVEEGVKIQVETLRSEELPALIILSEETRRIKEMSTMMGASMRFAFPDDKTLVLNRNNPIIAKMLSLDEEKQALIARQVYDLARMTNEPMAPELMTEFIIRSNKLLGLLV
ncbi:MAG: molecular chaperone HtpG [Clostridia bacterium]|nr:molecular chaperone HtpG [Clostridia bacterium]